MTGATRDDLVPRLRAAANDVADAIVSVAFRAHGSVTWLGWRLDGAGRPDTMRAGDPTLYDGDAGVAWALADLARQLDREDLARLARDAALDALRRAPAQGGLAQGRAGVLLAARRVSARLDDAPPTVVPARTTQDADVVSGAAGEILALVGDPTPGARTARADAVARLDAAAVHGSVGVCWDSAAGPVPLTGLSHGASGVAWALAEAAAADDALVRRVAPLVRGALAWEETWQDGVRGGWPDLRDPGTGASAGTYGAPDGARWCHGSAGIGAVRLRLLALADTGLDLGLDLDALRADSEAAVRLCGRALQEASVGSAAGGSTLCHGLGGPAELLLLGHAAGGAPELLGTVRAALAGMVEELASGAHGTDGPLSWPAGIDREGSVGLFLGLAGVGLVLARAADPDGGSRSPALLGLGG